MRRYILQIEAKVRAPESEVAITRMRKYIQKWSEDVRVVSITDEGGEKTYIDKGLVETKF